MVCGADKTMHTVIDCGWCHVKGFAKHGKPKKIPKDFFADNLPCADLYISGSHILYLPSNIAQTKHALATARISARVCPLSEHVPVIAYVIDKLETLGMDEMSAISGEKRFYNMVLDSFNGIVASGVAFETLTRDQWTKGQFVSNAHMDD